MLSVKSGAALTAGNWAALVRLRRGFRFPARGVL